MWFLINTKILWIMWIITKLKLKSEILNQFFYKFFYKFFFIYLCIKRSKTLSAKYYQENIKKDNKKSSWKISKSF